MPAAGLTCQGIFIICLREEEESAGAHHAAAIAAIAAEPGLTLM